MLLCVCHFFIGYWLHFLFIHQKHSKPEQTDSVAGDLEITVDVVSVTSTKKEISPNTFNPNVLMNTSVPIHASVH